MFEFSLKSHTSLTVRLWLATVLAVLMIGVLAGVASAATITSDAGPWASYPDANWPNCGFNCEAGDVNFTSLYLADEFGNPLPTCTPGETVTGYVWGSFSNTSGTERYAVVLLGDIYINGNYVSTLNTGSTPGVCGGNVLPSGTSNNSLTALQWTCGEAVEIRNVTVSWDTNSATCSQFFNSPSCGNRKTKCGTFSNAVVVRPLVEADFTAANACVGTPLQFINTTSGGVAPMSYSWNFGDGGSSSLSDPTHTYTSAGTYTVGLVAGDSSTPPVTDTATQMVTVYDVPSSSYTYSQVSTTSTSVTYSFSAPPPPANGCTPTYLWDFGDGSTSTDANPQHTFVRRSIPYNVVLTVTACGCSSTSNVSVSSPLAVTLASFEAMQQGSFIRITWETTTELNNRGFNVYRGVSPVAPAQQLNATLIPSQAQGSGMGFLYTWDDSADLAENQTYWYWLQDVDIYGIATLHGPVSVTFGAPTAVTIGNLQAGPASAALPFASVLAGLLAPAAAAWILRRQRS